MTPTPSEQVESWVPRSDAPEAAIGRLLLALLVVGIGAAFAASLTRGAADYRRGLAGALRRAIRPEPPPWVRTEWVCGSCRSVNNGRARRCASCRRERAAVELTFTPSPTMPDQIPAEIAVPPGSRLTLEHNPAAHADGLTGHWRLRVNGAVVGSAARRDGALALLRAVVGADTIMFDPRETGFSTYRLAELVVAFERPRLPVDVPCPEH